MFAIKAEVRSWPEAPNALRTSRSSAVGFNNFVNASADAANTHIHTGATVPRERSVPGHPPRRKTHPIRLAFGAPQVPARVTVPSSASWLVQPSAWGRPRGSSKRLMAWAIAISAGLWFAHDRRRIGAASILFHGMFPAPRRGTTVATGDWIGLGGHQPDDAWIHVTTHGPSRGAFRSGGWTPIGLSTSCEAEAG